MRSALPFVSVVVPTRDRPTQLRDCLAALSRTDYPRDRLEVLVVDDGSRRPLGPVVDAAARELPVQLLRQRNTGPAGARNAGLAAASGTVVAFTDDDCRPRPDWIRGLAGAVELDPPTLAGGLTVNGLAANAYSVASHLILDLVYDFYNAPPDGPRFFASNNIACPADALRSIGGFDTTFPAAAAEDRELCDVWRHAGFALVHAPAAVVEHRHRLSLTRFWRQHFAYGRGAARFHVKRSARSGDGLAPDLVFHRALPRLLRRRLSGASLQDAGTAMTLLAVWQVANASGYLAERLARRL